MRPILKSFLPDWLSIMQLAPERCQEYLLENVQNAGIKLSIITMGAMHQNTGLMSFPCVEFAISALIKSRINDHWPIIILCRLTVNLGHSGACCFPRPAARHLASL